MKPILAYKKFWEERGTTPCLYHPSALAAFVSTLSYTLFSPFRRLCSKGPDKISGELNPPRPSRQLTHIGLLQICYGIDRSFAALSSPFPISRKFICMLKNTLTTVTRLEQAQNCFRLFQFFVSVLSQNVRRALNRALWFRPVAPSCDTTARWQRIAAGSSQRIH